MPIVRTTTRPTGSNSFGDARHSELAQQGAAHRRQAERADQRLQQPKPGERQDDRIGDRAEHQIDRPGGHGHCEQHSETAGAEMKDRDRAVPPRQVAADDDPRQQLARGLRKALVPAQLLPLPGTERVGQLARHTDRSQIERAPPGELGAIAEIEILGQRVAVPAAGGLDRRPAPDAAGTVERQELAGPAPGRLLDRVMAVENDLLRTRHPVLRRVQIVAARLHEGEIGLSQQRT